MDAALPEVRSRRNLEAVVARIERLVRAGLTPELFHPQFLELLAEAVGARAVAVWVPNGDELRLAADVGLAALGLTDAAEHRLRHAQLLREVVVQERCGRLTPAQVAEAVPNGSPVGPWIVCELVCEARPMGVLEVVLPDDTTAGAARGAIEFVRGIGELAAEYYLRAEVRQLRGLQRRQQQIDDFTRRLQPNLDPREAVGVIVQEGRPLVGCDRLWLLLPRGRGFAVRDVSGLAEFNQRSNQVRLLRKLVEQVAVRQRELRWPEQSALLPEGLQREFERYQQLSSVSRVSIKCVTASAEAEDSSDFVGVLVAEEFSEQAGTANELSPSSDRIRPRLAPTAEVSVVCERLAMLAELSRSTLVNIGVIESVPLLGLWRWLGRMTSLRRLSRMAAGLLVLGILVAVLVLLPTDFTIEAEGELQPARLRHVFAPRTGVVRELAVQSDQPVQADEVLIVLRDPDLDLEFKRLRGEIQTTSQRLSSVEAARVQSGFGAATDSTALGRLSAEEEELKTKLKNLKEQHAALEAQQNELTVRSPITGAVLTWDFEDRLQSRPVQRGQHLLTIGDVAGPWVMTVFVPETSGGHVLQAATAAGLSRTLAEETAGQGGLALSYVLATDPTRTWDGHLSQIGLTIEAHQVGAAQRSLQGRMRIEPDAVAGLRPGSTAHVRIQCGRRSLGFVLFHQLYETLRGKLFFLEEMF